MRAITWRMSTGFFMSAPNRPSRSSAGSSGSGPSGQAARGCQPSERDQLARHRQGAGVVVGDVLGQAGDGGVHVGAAERLVVGDLAGGGLEQRRAGEEGAAAAADHDHVVGQAGHVGAAGGRRAVHDADHRQAGGREAGEVVEERCRRG